MRSYGEDYARPCLQSEKCSGLVEYVEREICGDSLSFVRGRCGDRLDPSLKR